MFKNILMPTDGSKHSERAIERGVELAKLCGAKVTGLHVLPNYQLTIAFEDTMIDPVAKEEIDKEAAMRAARFLEFVQNTAAATGVAYDTVIATNDFPYDAIVDTANERGCDLIVLTARHRRGLMSLIIGRKSDRVLHRASIPVLTFRALMSADHPDQTPRKWQHLFQRKTKGSGNNVHA